jgi:hypothetical protein
VQVGEGAGFRSISAGSRFAFERPPVVVAPSRHGASATMAEHQPLIAAVLDGPPEVRVLDPVVLGEAAKGSLAG